MEQAFSPEEIVRLAATVEDQGRQLYAQLEQQTDDAALKRTWKFLKEQEECHKQGLQDLLGQTGAEVFEYAAQEYHDYLDAIASEYVLTRDRLQRSLNQPPHSVEEALALAMNLKKEAIVAYTALQEHLVADKKDIVVAMIKEEQSHLVMLTRLKRKLTKGD